jgi:hypothetical protein
MQLSPAWTEGFDLFVFSYFNALESYVAVSQDSVKQA